MQSSHKKHVLQFIRAGKTSRGTLHNKETWLIKIWDENNPDVYGIGECAVFRGLSSDDKPEYEEVLKYSLQQINNSQALLNDISVWPSIKFGIETALHDLQNGGKRIIFHNRFSRGEKAIKINGLIWMGELDFMLQQLQQKIELGYDCVKLKIGGLNFDDELKLLKGIRKVYPAEKLEIRVDANGAFTPEKAKTVLDELNKLAIHSIEQPIKQGQWNEMQQLCKNTPTPIALDEELIGIHTIQQKKELIEFIKPQFIILKPSLVGGFTASQEWITIAEENNIGWWITSALESNVGLNAIAQFTAEYDLKLPQGLGTGQLFSNNFHSALHLEGQHLHYSQTHNWHNFDTL